jgi:AcrR family transcriptional regulator
MSIRKGDGRGIMSEGKRAAQAIQSRTRLLTAARRLFASQGFTATSTEQVLAETAMTRGALYHHFRDKADLFAAVCEQLQVEAVAAIASAVAAAQGKGADPFAVLVAGCDAWLDYVATGDARRILVLEAPSVLGWQRWNDLDQRHGFALLREGVRAAQDDGALPPMPGDVLAVLLNGAMNYAVMAATGPDATEQLAASKAALHAILEALRARAATT